MRALYVTAENLDGTRHQGVRVLAADRVRAQAVARANSVPWAEGPQCESLIAWAAMHRSGATTALYEQWLEEVADFALTNTAPHEDEEDPTSAPQGA